MARRGGVLRRCGAVGASWCCSGHMAAAALDLAGAPSRARGSGRRRHAGAARFGRGAIARGLFGASAVVVKRSWIAGGRARVVGQSQTLNPYAYARNSPLQYTDPTGLVSLSISFSLSFTSGGDVQFGGFAARAEEGSSGSEGVSTRSGTRYSAVLDTGSNSSTNGIAYESDVITCLGPLLTQLRRRAGRWAPTRCRSLSGPRRGVSAPRSASGRDAG